jgi:hypothetical protein
MKKEIFVTNMTINIKKDAIKAAEALVNGEVSNLETQKLYFANDKKLVNLLFEDIKKGA